MNRPMMFVRFFFFNDTATTEIYTLSLHDALPISAPGVRGQRGLRQGDGERPAGLLGHAPEGAHLVVHVDEVGHRLEHAQDRKSTRLNSSHANISYAVFCLKKKKILPHHVIISNHY